MISLQSKGLSRVSNTTVQKHQFFSVCVISVIAKKENVFLKNSALLLVKIACVKLPQKKYEDVAFKKLDICKPQTKGALEQEVKEEKAALEKPVDLEEEKKQSDGEIVEKGRPVMTIYKGDPGQSSLRKVD